MQSISIFNPHNVSLHHNKQEASAMATTENMQIKRPSASQANPYPSDMRVKVGGLWFSLDSETYHKLHRAPSKRCSNKEKCRGHAKRQQVPAVMDLFLDHVRGFDGDNDDIWPFGNFWLLLVIILVVYICFFRIWWIHRRRGEGGWQAGLSPWTGVVSGSLFFMSRPSFLLLRFRSF